MGVKKYEIDTPENREFLKEQSVELLEFGRRFASPGGSAYYLYQPRIGNIEDELFHIRGSVVWRA